MERLSHELWAKSSPFMSLWTHSLCAGVCTELFLSAKSSSKVPSFLFAGGFLSPFSVVVIKENL